MPSFTKSRVFISSILHFLLSCTSTLTYIFSVLMFPHVIQHNKSLPKEKTILLYFT